MYAEGHDQAHFTTLKGAEACISGVCKVYEKLTSLEGQQQKPCVQGTLERGRRQPGTRASQAAESAPGLQLCHPTEHDLISHP